MDAAAASSTAPTLPRGLLGTAFAFSGFAALVYETVWARLLALSFGATTEALATVLAAFMAGLALGGGFGGRLADRLSPRAALRLFAHLEIAIAALSLLSLLVLAGFAGTYAALEHWTGGGRAARSLAAALILVPPTALMGATLPLLARAAIQDVRSQPAAPGLGARPASTIAWLYAVNTVGAVLGALATGFALIPGIGLARSVGLAALLDVVAAVLVYRLARRQETAPAGPGGAAATAPVAAAVAEATSGAAPGAGVRPLLLLAAALSGAVALGLEVLWGRTLVLTVGSSTQALALMLGTFLGGIALGSWLYARVADRLPADARLPALLLGAIAVASVLLLRLAALLPFVYLALWEHLPDGALGLVLMRLLPATALMLGPTVLMGAALPALVRTFGRTAERAARDLGVVYAANTAGAILGSLLVCLWALPALGVTRATMLPAAAGLGGGGAAALAARLDGARRTGPVFLALLAATGLLAASPAWDPRVMARGLSYHADRAAELKREGRLGPAIAGLRVVYYRDGAESSVLVYDTGEGTLRSFVVNGRHEATSSPNDMRNQYLLGHLPALLHPGPVRTGLVIALGSGMTAGALSRHAERVTVVEIEPAVLGAAAAFAPWNHDVLGDPRVEVVIDDGRHFLLTTPGRYDVITVDPIHPSVAGSEMLYSLEQYHLVRDRLAPGGVAAQWLPLYQMGIEDARVITRTFHEAFPDAQVWVNGADAILIGGTGERLRPAAEIRDALARPEVAASLAAVRQGRLATLLAGFAVGPPRISGYVAGAAVSRDDRPIVEFSLPWQTYRDTTDRNLLEIYRFGGEPPQAALEGLSAEETAEVERAFAAVGFDQAALALRLVKHADKADALFERALELDPDNAIARQALRR